MLKIKHLKASRIELAGLDYTSEKIYRDDEIPKNEIRLGTVFYANGEGFGIVRNIAVAEDIIEAVGYSDNYVFIGSEVNEHCYTCVKRVRRKELMSQLSPAQAIIYTAHEQEALDNWARSMAEELGVPVEEVILPSLQICSLPISSIYILGEVDLSPFADVDGEVDVLDAQNALEKFFDDFAKEYKKTQAITQ